MTDDGTTFSVFLDGRAANKSKPAGANKHALPLKTAGGFVVGNWADENRGYCGDIAGVMFYDSCLSSGDINTVMAASKPSQPPAPRCPLPAPPGHPKQQLSSVVLHLVDCT